jgi:hypothetical protein
MDQVYPPTASQQEISIFLSVSRGLPLMLCELDKMVDMRKAFSHRVQVAIW